MAEELNIKFNFNLNLYSYMLLLANILDVQLQSVNLHLGPENINKVGQTKRDHEILMGDKQKLMKKYLDVGQ